MQRPRVSQNAMVIRIVGSKYWTNDPSPTWTEMSSSLTNADTFRKDLNYIGCVRRSVEVEDLLMKSQTLTVAASVMPLKYTGLNGIRNLMH